MEITKFTTADFMAQFGPALIQTASKAYPPVVQLGHRTLDFDVLKRPPMGKQYDAIEALVASLKINKGTFLVAEMGSGKSQMSIAGGILGMSTLKPSRTLVLCPPHLTQKWVREIKAVKPDIHAEVISSITDLQRIRNLPSGFFVLSREAAKLGPSWIPAVGKRLRRGTLTRYHTLHCPTCGEHLMLEDELMSLADLEAKRRQCVCGAPLWQVNNKGIRRYALGDFISRYFPKHFFDLLIVDEMQEYKSGVSAQGQVAGALAESCKKVLALTGTLFGGYASTLFHLLYRFSPRIRQEFKHNQETEFVSRFGLFETIEKHNEDDGRTSRRKGRSVSVRERPGVNPGLLPYLVANTVFLTLGDVAAALPKYEEIPVWLDLEGQQKTNYSFLERTLKDVMQEHRGSKRLLGAYLQSLLNYPDMPFRDEDVYMKNPDTNERVLVASVSALSEETIYSKEAELLKIVKSELAQGRKCWVFVQSTDTRDLTPRLQKLLEAEHLSVKVLKSHTVKADRREAWVEKAVGDGAQVILSHPKLVQTGLDLLAFPSLLFYQTEPSTYVLRQSSRRSWRIGQSKPVRVFHLVYRNTMQHRLVGLVARKARNSLALEGQLQSSGLTDVAEQDIMLALAQSLAEQVPISEEWQPISTTDHDRFISEVDAESFDPAQTANATEALLFLVNETRTIGSGKRKRVIAAGTQTLFDLFA